MTAYPLEQEPDHALDLGPAHQAREAEIISLEAVSVGSVQPGMRVLLKHMLAECELDTLAVKGRITEPQWRAGMLFRVKWVCCTKRPRVSASYGDVRGGCSNEGEDAALRRAVASRDIQEAFDVLGLTRDVIVDVCGEDAKLGTRIVVLRAGLDILRQLYRVPADYQRFQTQGR